jgi:hypothetical protein
MLTSDKQKTKEKNATNDTVNVRSNSRYTFVT